MNNNRILWIVAGVCGAAFLLLLPVLLARGPNPIVVIETSIGDIKIELLRDRAPVSVDNFLAYVNDKHYDDTIFHRVVMSGIYVIQGGGLERDMTPRKTKRGPIRNEASNGIKNERGTIAMARGEEADTATDQFFINVKDNRGFDKPPAADERPGLPFGQKRDGYAVFGKVIDGMEVVDNISKVTTMTVPGPDGHPMPDVPDLDNPIIIKSVRVIQ